MAHSSRTYGSTDHRTDVPDVGFSPTELYSLSENIISKLQNLNASYRILERAYKQIGTNKDSQILRDKVHVTQMSTNEVVSQTLKDIARLTFLMRRGDKEQKLQIEKLTSEFKHALQKYSEMQRSIADKMKKHILVTSHIETHDDEEDEKQSLLQVQEDARQRAEQRALEFDHGLILEQEERIKRIEGDILDVNQIMRELGAVVHQQADSINTIENNIESAYGQVACGAEELIKASNHQNKIRKSFCFIFSIAIFFVTILIVVILSNKSS
ncbi:syntaxin-12 [Copidosoma floridanum]|uniref:syntaxin-12 n=1 Tax=Copidosoma floridanum TaxID=29053 RepID=UPI0006C98684|nr:syntaxin-12 [Copidosoma floridanum]